MYELYPYFTNDGSVGLFSPEADDIYHSTYGALSEAYEKFILPANLNLYFNDYKEIKILDICYGIGYNSKSFLNYFFEKNKKTNYSKKECNETIHTDNILKKNLPQENASNNKYIAQSDTNNNLPNVFIHALDTDKNLLFLSPLFKSSKKNIKNQKLLFKNDKITKLLNKKNVSKYKLQKEVNIILLKSIAENYAEIFDDKEFNNIITQKKYRQYFDKYMLNLYKFYKNSRYNKTLLKSLSAFLHNIYYKYLSMSHKKAAKALYLHKILFKPEINDARIALKQSNLVYDIVFLDAFTPTKCPCLWTLDFFKEIYNHLDDNGIILTYSNSANIRNAFMQADFHVGKIYNKLYDKYTGTVAVKNKSLILNNPYLSELSEYDLGLIKTKAGIIYRDEDLSLDNEAIIAAHKKEVENSNLISSSKYIKTARRKNEI